MKNGCNKESTMQLPQEYYILLGNVFQIGFEIGISEKDNKCKEWIIYGGRDINKGIIYPQLIKSIKLSEKYGDIIKRVILYMKRGETNGANIDDLFSYLIEADRQCQKYESKSNYYDYNDLSEVCKYKDKLNALNLLKSGYDFGIIFKKHLEKNDKYQEAKIIVEPNIGICGDGKRPDAVVAIPHKLNNAITHYEVMAIVELKTQFYLTLTNNKIMLNDFVDNIDLQSYTLEELELAKNNNDEILYINNFKLLYNILSKYGKGISYIEDIGKYPMDCLVVFPSTASLLPVEDEDKLDELKEKLEGLLPSKVKVYGKGIYDISKLLRYDLIQGLYNNGCIIKDGEDYYYKQSGYNDEEDKYNILDNAELLDNEGEDFKHTELLNRSSDTESKTGRDNEHIQTIRMEHEHIFKPLLESDEYDVIINASGQGVGKNTTLCKYILDQKLKNDGHITILFTPRKAIMGSMKKDLKDLIMGEKKSIEKYKNIDSELGWVGEIYSEKNSNISRKRGKYYEKIVDYYAASEKLERIITKKEDKEYNLISCTSQTLPYYLVRGKGGRSINYNLLFKLLQYADLIVFDELSNSDMTVKWAFLRILKYINTLKKEGCTHSKVAVLDASITSKELYSKMLNEHLVNKSKYTPFDVEIKKVDDEGKNKLDRLDMYYFKKNIEFNLNVFPSIVELDESVKYTPNKYASPQNVKRILNCINDELIRRNSNLDVDKILEKHNCLFYVDNKLTIDSVVEYLKKRGIKIASIQAERVGKFDKETLNKHNIIGTSSIAFGMSFPYKKLLIALPPVVDSRYYDSLSQVELMRQVIKRMRGGSNDSIKKYVGVCDIVTSEEQKRISYYMINNAINHRVLNKNYHIITPHYSGNLPPIQISNGNEIGKMNQISFEEFIKNYYSSLRRIFGMADINLKISYYVNVDRAAISNFHLPPYLAYNITNPNAEEFKLMLTPLNGKGMKHTNKLIKLFKDGGHRVRDYDNGLKILSAALFGDSTSTIDEIREELESIKSEVEADGIKNGDWRFCGRLSRKLIPKQISVSIDSSCVLTLPWAEDYNNKGDGGTAYSILYSRGSPLRNFFFGDSNYLEELIDIKFERDGEVVGQSKGYYIHHHLLRHRKKFMDIMLEACSREFITSKTIIPHISKLI